MKWEDVGLSYESFRPDPYPTSLYGIRPHRYVMPQKMSAQFEMTEINRPAAELLFDMCLKCNAMHLATCDCHERGYN